MDRYRELMRIKEEAYKKEQELVEDIILNELRLTHLEKQIYLQNKENKSWSYISQNLNVSTDDVYMCLKKISERYKRWLRDKENKFKNPFQMEQVAERSRIRHHRKKGNRM